MRISETVVFGGGGLERAAHLRGEPSVLKGFADDGTARAVVLWRGKPLVKRDGGAVTVARLQCNHPVLSEARAAAVFLGMAESVPIFAYDISDWEPEDVD